MNAIDFVKKFGICEAKRIVEYRDNHANSTHVFKFNKSCVDKGVISDGAYLYTKSYNDYSVSVGDLKQIVEAFELVDQFDDINQAKAYLPDIDNDVPWNVKGKELRFFKWQLQEAIDLVEQCQ